MTAFRSTVWTSLPWAALPATGPDLDVMVLCRDVAQLRESAPIDIDLRKADPGLRPTVVAGSLCILR